MDSSVIHGWDIGGAHVKVCRLEAGLVADVVQWPCPLWQGLARLHEALEQARRRWPDLAHTPHAVTMTGEMVDLFSDREDGVHRICDALGGALGAPEAALRYFAGSSGWCTGAAAASRWREIASANWQATAMHVARHVDEGVLVDIGSTTTDLIALRRGQVQGAGASDAQRLVSGELVYHGVVRTPLCAVAQRIPVKGRPHNVMNEFFATSADVYRLTGELNPAHDQHPSADGAPKDLPSTRRRLARMVGLDAHDASDADWLACAHAWRAAQLAEIAGQLRRVCIAHTLARDAPLVSAGCGDFLVEALATITRRPCLRYGTQVARVAPGAPPGTARWAQVCAPSVAVAVALAQEPR